MTIRDLLLLLPARGWRVCRDVPLSTLMFACAIGVVAAHRSGPASSVYEVRLTGKGREYLRAGGLS
jgi:hypothetical protein